MRHEFEEIVDQLIGHQITKKIAVDKLLLLYSVMSSAHTLGCLRDLRKNKGLTLRQVEDMTGISNGYLSQLETGKIKSPSYKVLMKLNALYSSET